MNALLLSLVLPGLVAAEPAVAPAPVKPSAADAGAPAMAKKGPAPVLVFKDGLATPESVLHDEKADLYLVSNVNGSPLAKDNNGFISQLGPDGKFVNSKWIAGGVNQVTLHAPKGLGISKGVLYVTDIDVLRKFDAATGKPKGTLLVPGATFLNDVAVAPDGTVVFSDTGMKASSDGFEPSGSDALYTVGKDGKVKLLLKSPDLGRPNGLWATTDGVWVATYGSNELYLVDWKGKRGASVKVPKGSLDGLVSLGDDLLVSSWESSSLFRGKPGGEFVEVLTGLKAPADIGVDKVRGRVMVPLFMDHQVQVFELK